MPEPVKRADPVGRDRELESLRRVVAELRGGAGTSTIVEGPPGIGKSVLLGLTRSEAEAAGVQVLDATGVEVEAQLPFAGLHQVLRPLLDRIRELPPRQRAALLSAFGMGEPIAPDHFLIGLAALELLSESAASAPVLVLIEDGHWLDRPSGQVLSFIARRIRDEPLSILMAQRAGYPSPLQGVGSVVLEIAPLDQESAAAVLERIAPELPDALRTRILLEAAGNPLALRELPRLLPAEQDPPQSQQLPLTARLQRAFTARLLQLPDRCRTAALIAAADDDNVLSELLDAGTLVLRSNDAASEAFEQLLASQLATVSDARLLFDHPLVRSAIYQRAGPTERRRAHAALADVLASQPDRRAWHRAAAALGPDEAVASELEGAGLRAEARGGTASALATLERAAELTPDVSVRGGRFVRAAALALTLGDPARARDLADRADPQVLRELDSARLALVRETTDPGDPGDPTAVRSLVAASERVSALGEIDLALRFLRAAALRCHWADTGADARASVLAAADRVAVPADDPRLLAIRGLTDPEQYSSVVIAQASRLMQAGIDPESADELSLVVGAAGSFDVSAALLAAAVRGLRERGHLGKLPQVLTTQAWGAITTMDRQVALPAAEEAARLAGELHQPLWEAGAVTGLAMLAGLQGDDDQAQRLIRRAEAIVLPLRAAAYLCGIQLTRGVAALANGRFDEAFVQLLRPFDPTDISYHRFQSWWAIGDLAEAAAHSGHVGQARSVLAAAEGLDEGSESPWLRAGLVYARPLLAEDADAEELFQAGVRADLSRWPVYRARLLLEYGIWLRRQRRPAEARAPLRSAIEAFDALGVLPWLERARQELRASGETSRPPTQVAWARLSPQELQIAKMAAQGMSNRAIGEQLYLSHRTVGSHLYRIFPKLGIASRAQLRTIGLEAA